MYYVIKVKGEIIYACTDVHRFARQAVKYASAADVTLETVV